jgi:hypothetical protein
MDTQVRRLGKQNTSTAYSAWFNKSVVLVVLIRGCDIPMHCSIVGESANDVRVRVEPGWEMDVRKELILAVEEVAGTQDIHIN